MNIQYIPMVDDVYFYPENSQYNTAKVNNLLKRTSHILCKQNGMLCVYGYYGYTLYRNLNFLIVLNDNICCTYPLNLYVN